MFKNFITDLKFKLQDSLKKLRKKGSHDEYEDDYEEEYEEGHEEKIFPSEDSDETITHQSDDEKTIVSDPEEIKTQIIEYKNENKDEDLFDDDDDDDDDFLNEEDPNKKNFKNFLNTKAGLAAKVLTAISVVYLIINHFSSDTKVDIADHSMVKKVAMKEVKRPEMPKAEIVKEEMIKPEIAKEEVPEPKVTKEEVVKPEVAKEEMPEPEVTKEEMVKPEIAKEEMPEPKVTKEEMAKPEIAKEEMPEPEVTEEEVIKKEKLSSTSPSGEALSFIQEMIPNPQKKYDFIKSPPFLSQNMGRGLVYNCQGKHWACVNKESYLQCKNHAKWSLAEEKLPDCVINSIYITFNSCKAAQFQKIEGLATPDYCESKSSREPAGLVINEEDIPYEVGP